MATSRGRQAPATPAASNDSAANVSTDEETENSHLFEFDAADEAAFGSPTPAADATRTAERTTTADVPTARRKKKNRRKDKKDAGSRAFVSSQPLARPAETGFVSSPFKASVDAQNDRIRFAINSNISVAIGPPVPMAVTASTASTASSGMTSSTIATSSSTANAVYSPSITAMEAAAGFMDALRIDESADGYGTDADLLVSEHDQVLDIHNFAASDAECADSSEVTAAVEATSEQTEKQDECVDAQNQEDANRLLTSESAKLSTSVRGSEIGRHKACLDDFELLRVIGRGAYGKVFLVRRKDVNAGDANRGLFAMKVLKKASIVLHGKDAEHTQNERSILEAVRHPFIVKLYYAFQTRERLYLILSYASGGELFTHLAMERMFSEDAACFYMSELVLAIDHLHSIGIIYRDLKPENVLLDAQGHIVLTDFGLSKVAVDAVTVCGTVEFMAPEVLDERRAYGKAVDYWSLGVMLFDMLTGAPPFTGRNRKKIMEAIVRKKVVFPPFMTASARDLCGKLLRKSPEQRLGSGPDGSANVKRHLFFRRVDWQKVLQRQVSPPFVPPLAAADDTSHFQKEFTLMPLAESPSADNLRLSHANAFVGFSFVANDAQFPQESET